MTKTYSALVQRYSTVCYLLSAQEDVYSVTASSPANAQGKWEREINMRTVEKAKKKLWRRRRRSYLSGSNRRLWPRLVSGSWRADPPPSSRCTPWSHPSSAEAPQTLIVIINAQKQSTLCYRCIRIKHRLPVWTWRDALLRFKKEIKQGRASGTIFFWTYPPIKFDIKSPDDGKY